jgi:hypothetical protein
MHFVAMVLFAFFVAIVFSVTTKNDLRERFTYGLKVFAAFLGIAIALGWLMYPIS